MKQKIGSVLGLVLIALMVIYSPWGNQPDEGSFTDIFRTWGDQQEEASDRYISETVSGVEGSWVGEHEIDGSNWAIPNIIRHLIGVD